MSSRPVIPSENRVTLVRWSILLLTAAIVVAAIGIIFFSRRGNGVTVVRSIHPGVVRAVAINGQLEAVATANDRLTIWRNGLVITQQPRKNLITALTALPSGKDFAAGTSTGKVLTLDTKLDLIRSFQVPGRVTGLSSGPGRTLFVTYGNGYAPRYRVDLLDSSGKVRLSTNVGFPTTDLISLGGRPVYGNSEGDVGMLESGGKVAWTTTLQHAVTRLAPLAGQDGLIAGDSRGGLYRLSLEGHIAWHRVVSQYRVQALTALPGGVVVAGTSDGSLFGLNRHGKLFFSQKVVSSPVIEILPNKTGAVTVVFENGAIRQLSLPSEQSGNLNRGLRVAWFTTVALLLIGAIVFAVRGVGRWSSHARSIGRQVRRSYLAYLLLTPTILGLTVFHYYPALTAFYYALTNFNLSSPIRFVGLQNFQMLLADHYFWVGVGNMLLLLIVDVAKVISIPLLAAELVFWVRNQRIQYAYRVAFVLPAVVPGVVMTLLWRMLYDPKFGLINQVLQAIGLSQYQHAWLDNAHTALASVMFVGFPWVGVFPFLVYLGGLLGINREMFEAASIDGANWWNRFLHIDVPSLRPQFRLLLFFTFIGSLQGFVGIWILTGGGPGTATYVPALEMFVMITQGGRIGYAAAIGVALAAVVFILVFSRLRFEGETE